MTSYLMNRRVNSEINLALSACSNLLKLICFSYEVNKSNDTVVMIHIIYTCNKYILNHTSYEIHSIM